MNRKTLTKALTRLSTVKRLELSETLIDVWYSALRNIDDDTGLAAFEALSARQTYGSPEPADLILDAEKIQNKRVLNQPHKWISEAPKFEGHKDFFNPSAEFQDFLRIERQKKYMSKDARGEIFLVTNPEAWDWLILGQDRISVIRPKPISTGSIIPEPKTKGGRQGSWDR